MIYYDIKEVKKHMTIAALHKELSGVIKEHSVYGAEAIVNALVYGSEGNKYLDRAEIHKLVDAALIGGMKNVKSKY